MSVRDICELGSLMEAEDADTFNLKTELNRLERDLNVCEKRLNFEKMNYKTRLKEYEQLDEKSEEMHYHFDTLVVKLKQWESDNIKDVQPKKINLQKEMDCVLSFQLIVIQQLQSMENQFNELESEVKDKNKLASEILPKVEDCASQRRTANEMIVSKIYQNNIKLNEQLEKLEKELSLKRELQKSLTQQVVQQKAGNVANELDIDDLKSRISHIKSTKEAEYNFLQRDMRARDKERLLAGSKSDELRRKIANLENDLKEREKEKNEVDKDIVLVENSIKKSQQDREEIVSKLSQAKEDLEKKSKQLSDSQGRVLISAQKIENKQMEREKTKKTNADNASVDALDNKDQQITELRESISTSKAKLQLLKEDEEYEQIQRELSESKGEETTLLLQIEKLSTDLASLNDAVARDVAELKALVPEVHNVKGIRIFILHEY